MIIEFSILSATLLVLGLVFTVLAALDVMSATVGDNRALALIIGRGSLVFYSVILLMVGLALSLDLSWMQWTQPTAIFFIGLFSLLLLMTVWDILNPQSHQQGFLPIGFSRGERLFLGFMIFFGTMFFWGAFLPDVNIYYGIGLSAVLFAVMAKFG